jgi:uncharacterized phage-associated protein
MMAVNMWVFRHNLEKTIEAAAVLLRTDRTQRMNYMKLLKLLYIADRESIKETGRPITGDHVVAMERGPVLSRTLDLIRGLDARSDQWSRFIEEDHHYVKLIESPGRGHLCRADIQTLERVAGRFEDYDEWDMVEYTHTLPEWLKNKSGTASRPIPLGDILSALGMADKEQDISARARESSAIRSFFGRNRSTHEAGRHVPN